MRDIRNQLECKECQYYREVDGYSWCSMWTGRAEMDGTYGEVVEVEPDGYCSEAIARLGFVEDKNDQYD